MARSHRKQASHQKSGPCPRCCLCAAGRCRRSRKNRTRVDSLPAPFDRSHAPAWELNPERSSVLLLIGSTPQLRNHPKQSSVLLPGHGYRGHGPLPQTSTAGAGAGHARDNPHKQAHPSRSGPCPRFFLPSGVLLVPPASSTGPEDATDMLKRMPHPSSPPFPHHVRSASASALTIRGAVIPSHNSGREG